MVLESKLSQIMLKADEFHKAVIDQLNEYIYELKIHSAELQNRIMVNLNVENYLLSIKSLLKKYSLPIRSIDEFPYKKLFSKIIVLEHNKIFFVIDRRNDYENINLSQELIYSDSILHQTKKRQTIVLKSSFRI